MSREVFVPKQFSLPEDEHRYELDTEVAAHIASDVYSLTRAYRGQGLDVVREIGVHPYDCASKGDVVAAGVGRDYAVPEYIAAFTVSEDSSILNGRFGRAMQMAFDQADHRGRSGWGWSLGASSVFPAITGIIETGLATNHARVEALTTVGGMGGGLSLFVGGLAAHNLYRRAVTNPEHRIINNLHLNRAEKAAAKLALPPVVVLS